MTSHTIETAMLNVFEEPWKDAAWYRDQWQQYYAERDRRIARLGLLLAGFGVVAIIIALVPESAKARHPTLVLTLVAIGGAFWLVLLVQGAKSNWTMGSWDCPRCGEPFFVGAFVRNPLGRIAGTAVFKSQRKRT